MAESEAETPSEVQLRGLLAQGSRDWAEEYFDLIAKVYDLMVTDAADPRISVTMPKNKPDIYVTINNRWVLQPVFGKSDDKYVESAGIILGDEFRRTLEEELQIDPWQFKRRGKEPEAPWLVRFLDFSFVSNEAIMNEWRCAMIDTLKFGSRSANRKFHEPLLSELALDKTARNGFFEGVKWTDMGN